jgi:hypothetical protein
MDNDKLLIEYANKKKKKTTRLFPLAFANVLFKESISKSVKNYLPS